MTTATTASITVVTPGPQGGTSNAQTFTVVNSQAAATITSLVTTTGLTGGTASAFENTPFTLVINGSGFAQGATVTFGSARLTPTSVTPTQVTVAIPASVSLADSGEVVNVAVVNPGQAASNSLPFTVLTANQRFLYDIYHDLLHRQIDPSGLNELGSLARRRR